jgi:hypothetical protein
VTYENSPLLRSLLTLVWSVVAQIGSLLTLLRIRQDCLAPVATSQSQGEVGASSARSKAQIFKSSLSFFLTYSAFPQREVRRRFSKVLSLSLFVLTSSGLPQHEARRRFSKVLSLFFFTSSALPQREARRRSSKVLSRVASHSTCTGNFCPGTSVASGRPAAGPQKEPAPSGGDR